MTTRWVTVTHALKATSRSAHRVRIVTKLRITPLAPLAAPTQKVKPRLALVRFQRSALQCHLAADWDESFHQSRTGVLVMHFATSCWLGVWRVSASSQMRIDNLPTDFATVRLSRAHARRHTTFLGVAEYYVASCGRSSLLGFWIACSCTSHTCLACHA